MLGGSSKGRMPWPSEEYSCLKFERSEIKVSTRSQVILGFIVILFSTSRQEPIYYLN